MSASAKEKQSDYEILRVMMTEWVAAVRPPVADFVRAEIALNHFKRLLDGEAAADQKEPEPRYLGYAPLRREMRE